MAYAYFGAPQWVGDCIGYVAMLSFLVLVAGYAIKLWSSFDAVKAELNHPIAGGLFATPLISLLLLPILLVDLDLALARALWVTGALGMTIFAWLIVNRWMSVRQQINACDSCMDCPCRRHD